ncbi:MAG: YtxH domain-containing protein [Anaerolineae bacterium]
MVEESERSGNYFALGAIVGAALGAALALLFAPKPGEETRGMLKEKGIELKQRTRRATPDVSEWGSEAAGQDVPATAEEAVGEPDQG